MCRHYQLQHHVNPWPSYHVNNDVVALMMKDDHQTYTAVVVGHNGRHYKFKIMDSSCIVDETECEWVSKLPFNGVPPPCRELDARLSLGRPGVNRRMQP